MSKTVYITTPLYYVNAAPHIGHSYTNIAADSLSRYYRLKGDNVFLLTGTDEHGQKIQQAAAQTGKNPQDFADNVVKQFRSLWKLLHISYDDFIRTTEERHIRSVQAILARFRDKGVLKHASYQGWYCTPDETFWSEAELSKAPGEEKVPVCPNCRRRLEAVNEKGWHLPLRASQEWLKRFVKSHPNFVRPESRYNELLGLLAHPLPESLCITRPRRRVNWGIPVPFDKEHVTYVWFDALLNYITAPGFIENPKQFDTLWPADVQLIGKDILRHHAVYWPVMLHALGLSDEAMPQSIFAHGWWKIGERKMSKSLGNIVDPNVVIGQLLKGQPHAADIYRYFLLREVPFGQDGSFSEEVLFVRLGADLANDLGNLVNRALSMIERYCNGKIPEADAAASALGDEALREAAVGLALVVDDAMSRVAFSVALEAIMKVVSHANRYIEVAAPWKLAKQPDDIKRLHTVLRVQAEVIRIIAIALDPFMPSVAESIWRQLGCGSARRLLSDATTWPYLPAGQPIGEHPVLFPKQNAIASG